MALLALFQATFEVPSFNHAVLILGHGPATRPLRPFWL